MKARVFCSVFILIFLIHWALPGCKKSAVEPEAKIINVPVDQPTIQAGIDVATNGDTVLVQPGIYGEQIDFVGKNIVVGSMFIITGDPSYIYNTVIDGKSAPWRFVSLVRFTSGEDATAILSGFTITGGDYWDGGGIRCEGSGPSLMNLIISENSAMGGGGIYCENSSYPNLVNVIISGNKATHGGISTNGGGISCSNSRMNLVNVTISGNIARGVGIGGIDCNNSEINLVNTIVYSDYCNNEFYVRSGSINAFYSNIQGGWKGAGNIDLDPLFADTANGDYRLQEGSPCVDAGTAFFEYKDEILINLKPWQYNGSAPDMGAYLSGPPLVPKYPK